MTEDLVDVHFRPFVRALGNLVITFAICENELLSLVTAMVGDELRAINILKDQKTAKAEIVALARGLGLADFDRDELISGIDGFWNDKEIRNRLIHDYWFPNIVEPALINTRGVTRAKKPEIIFRDIDLDEVWALAARFQAYDDLFSYRTWALSRDE
ncbi:hypothetical protein [Bradyrhizobium japonicum]|uniref:hypothetical protein n=1 Tax=Bradyrhizobium japonicum TaxID=375 RepID=UPI000456F10D|nr:hypothetical protein [Bradyrhizobium japonicum]AHY52468.1 hypothetical protein BJS_05970 [Bradyrhizobium japonicum SEMIA 5079]MCD9110279.1 hypothetical protein [Bradyrhizobium japonicum]MCD9257458.1 hypothetical protein [Bradyrhizobium japonicum SEMIA 5079]MCD9823519.1 hypothetical protein [Bradyrhizobium japonicum]MCD9895122.1 hypothetical protein [Bradyrhizobium japonicum]